MNKIIKFLLVSTLFVIHLLSTPAFAADINIRNINPLPDKTTTNTEYTGTYLIETNPGKSVSIKTKYPLSYGFELIPSTEPGFCHTTTNMVMPQGGCKIKFKMHPRANPGQLRTSISACFGGLYCVAHEVSTEVLALNSISMSPANPSASKGSSQQFQVAGIYSDGSTKDISNQVAWSSNNGSIATVDNTGKALALAMGTALITATYQGKNTSQNFTVTPPELVKLQMVPDTAETPKGSEADFIVNGIYSDGSTKELTHEAAWISSNTNKAEPIRSGKIKTYKEGQVTITARSEGKSATATLNIGPPQLLSVSVSPDKTNFPKGKTLQLKAYGKYTDTPEGSEGIDITNQVTWSSEPNETVTFSDTTKGLITGKNAGKTTVTATLDNKAGNAEITIDPPVLESIDITEKDSKSSIPKGETAQFIATGNYSDRSEDITDKVAWSTSLCDVLAFSGTDQGLATGINIGKVEINATYENKNTSINFQVTPAELLSVTVTTDTPEIAKGETSQFKAYGKYTDTPEGSEGIDITDNANTVWESSNSNVATVDAQGLATTTAASLEDTANISATLDGKTGQASLTVTAAKLQSITIESTATSIPKGETNQFQAYGTYTDNHSEEITDRVEWSSTPDNLLSFSNTTKGLATGTNTGNDIKVNATLDGITGSFDFTVNPAELVSVSVTTNTPEIAKGETAQFKAYGKYTDTPEGSEGIDITNDANTAWESSNSNVATVNADGLATTTAASIEETTYISATLDGKTGQASLTVTAAKLQSITIESTVTSIPKGTYQQFTAKGTYSDGTENNNITNDVEWISSDLNKAAFDNSEKIGEIHALDSGETTVTAQKDGITSNELTLTIESPQLEKIEITTPDSTIAKGETLEFLAKGFYSDGSTKDDIAAELEWNSTSTTNSITFDNNLATGANEGTAIITVKQGEIQSTNSVTVTVEPHKLVEIEVTPNPATAYVGDNQQFTAKAIYTDTNPETGGVDITSLVSWRSTSTITATISDEQPTKGLATAISASETDIIAEFNPGVDSALTGTAHLTVSNHLPTINGITPTETARAANPLLSKTNGLDQKTTKELTISGQHFLDGAKVELNRNGKTISTSNIVVSEDTHSISCHIEIPNNTEVGKWDVIITNPDNQTATLKEAIEIKHPAPTAESISPNQGLNDESKTVTITGHDFIEKETAVIFGGKTATNIKVTKNGSSLTAKTPITELKGEVDVIIKTSGGESNPLKFTFQAKPKVTSIQPNFGWEKGGAVVTITGENFTEKSNIKFGKNKALKPITVNKSLKEITVIAPPGKNRAHVTVTTELGTSKESSSDLFYYDIPFNEAKTNSPLTISYNPTIYDISANQNSVFALNGSDLFIYDKQKNIWSKHQQVDLDNQHLTSVYTTEDSTHKPAKTYISSFEGNLYELKHDQSSTSKYKLHQLNSKDPEMYGNTKLYYDNGKVYMSGLFGMFGQDNAVGIYDENSYETSKFEYKTYQDLKLSTDDTNRSIIVDNDEILLATNKYLSSLNAGKYLNSNIHNIFKDDMYYYASTSQGLLYKYKHNDSHVWGKFNDIFENSPDYLTEGLVYDFIKTGITKIAATDVGLYISNIQDWKLHRTNKDFIYEGLVSNNIFKAFIDNNNAETIYALTDKGLSYTTDLGEKWHLSNLKTLSTVTDAKQIDINKHGILTVTSPKDGIVVYDTEAIKYTQQDGTTIIPFYRSRAFNLSIHHLPNTHIDKIKVMSKNHQTFAIANDQQTQTSILINRKVKKTAGEKAIDQEGNDITNKNINSWSYLSNKKDELFKSVKFLDVLEGTKTETLYLLTENLSQDDSTDKKGLKIFMSENLGNTWSLEKEFEKNPNLSKTVTVGKTNILVTNNGIYIVLEPPKIDLNYLGATYDLNNKLYLIDNYGDVYTYTENTSGTQRSYTKITSHIALGEIQNFYPVKNSEKATTLITTTYGMFIGEATKNPRDNTTIWVWNKLDAFSSELKIKNIASCIYTDKLNQQKMKIYAVDEKGSLHEAVYDL